MSTPILLLASYGLAFALVNEKALILTRILTNLPLVGILFSQMFACIFCTGFHTGWVMWVLWRVGGGQDLGTGSGITGCLLFAFASSAFCYSLDVLLSRLED